ncbi:hypothetical protein LOAG_06717, partial [Loa loa]
KGILKPKKPGEWDREWDAGKISVENWKENVPDIDSSKGPNAHFLRRFKNRNNIARSNNNVTSKKATEITEKKQKLEDAKDTICNETNKSISLSNKKIFNGKNSKNRKNSTNGNNDSGAGLRKTRCMKPVSRPKPSHASSNGQPNRQQQSGTYKKSSSGSLRKPYSTRRIASTGVANVPVPTVATQYLDTVKVNLSMLDDLKKDIQTSAKSNNNIGKVDNNSQKLSTIVVDSVTASTVPTLSVVKEYGN